MLRSNYVKHCTNCKDTAFEELDADRKPTGKCCRCGKRFKEERKKDDKDI